MGEPLRIFIAEDEPKIARFIEIELKHEGIEAEIEGNGRRAMERIIQGAYDLVLLDIMMPGMDGMEVCRRVREVSNIPIIMLTARDDVDDKVKGLDIGADDYMTKPFDTRELLARIRATLRKRAPQEEDSAQTEEKLAVRGLVLYPSRFEVQVNGEPVELTKKEYSLLEYLLRNKRMVLSRDQILQEVWGYDYAGDTNVVDVYIRYLRSKIDDKFHEKFIHTVRGVGYVIKE